MVVCVRQTFRLCQTRSLIGLCSRSPLAMKFSARMRMMAPRAYLKGEGR